MEFKVSMDRIRAILKLKYLEKQMAQKGFIINKKYVKRMEILLKVKYNEEGQKELTTDQSLNFPKLTDANIIRGSRYDIMGKSKPRLIAIPKGSELNYREAAHLTGKALKPIYALINDRLDANRPFVPQESISSLSSEDVKKNGLFVRNDKYETSRWRFVFADTSDSLKASPLEFNGNYSKISVIIREPNGDLRYAHPTEKKFLLMKEEESGTFEYLSNKFRKARILKYQ
jgi:hypothetical protein